MYICLLEELYDTKISLWTKRPTKHHPRLPPAAEIQPMPDSVSQLTLFHSCAMGACVSSQRNVDKCCAQRRPVCRVDMCRRAHRPDRSRCNDGFV